VGDAAVDEESLAGDVALDSEARKTTAPSIVGSPDV